MYKCPHCENVERYHYLNPSGDVKCNACEKVFRSDDLIYVKKEQEGLTPAEEQEWNDIQARDAWESKHKGGE